MLQIKQQNLLDVCYKVKGTVTEILAKLKETLVLEGNEVVEKQEYCMLDLVNKAKEEWLEAIKYFGEVTEPEHIDHAIFRIEAAEKQFVYLLKLSRQEGLVNENLKLN
jgi:hypothetical protein